METNSERKIVISIDDYIGAVRLKSKWRFFYNMLSMWILDYASYRVGYDPSDPKYKGWRKGLLRVDETNAEEYCEAMKSQEILPNQVPHVVKDTFPRQEPLTFVVNFDERLFVNGWHDNIPIHEYVPKGWTALEEDPYEYVPPEIRVLWGRK